MKEVKLEALYTLSDNKGVYISKGAQYIARNVGYQIYEIVGNSNNTLTFSKEEIDYRFKRV